MATSILHPADEAAMEAIGRRIADQLRAGDIVTLEGGLGAGKTTLARGILRGLGFSGEAPSPTFAIVQGYEPPDTQLPLAHVDLYRLEDAGEVEELGLDDWLASGALVIEWPDRLAGLYADIALAIHIAVDGEGGRTLTVDVPGAWKERWSQT